MSLINFLYATGVENTENQYKFLSEATFSAVHNHMLKTDSGTIMGKTWDSLYNCALKSLPDSKLFKEGLYWWTF